MKLGTPSRKVVIFGLSGALLLVIVALLLVYGSSMWPKQQTLSDKNQPATSQGNVKTQAAVPAKVETIKNGTTDVKILRTYIVIETKEQGDCTLTLSNAKHTYTAKNSTKGLDQLTGCLQWNVSTEGMEPGEYDLKVEFTGTNDHSVVRQKVKL